MVYMISLYLAVTVCVVGLAYKLSGWFRFAIGVHAPEMTALRRIGAASKGTLSVLFSHKLPRLVQALITDVLFQNHIRRQDMLRWTMHMLIFAGFTFLLVLHAFDRIIVTSLFDRYYLALNPYLLISGGMVMAGIAVAAYRRWFLKVPGLGTNAGDAYLLILLAVIMLSGMALESTKLTSYTHYQKIWNVHVGACLLGLALLPFSKLMHVFSTPVSLLTRAVMDETADPANIMTRRVMALDACVHCGNCSNRCSVAVAADIVGNRNVLPSERMVFLKQYIADKAVGEKGLAAIQQAICLCTNCDRCTVICPAGIDLRDLWFNAREELIQRGHAVPLMLTPFSFFRGMKRRDMDATIYDRPLRNAQQAVTAPFPLLNAVDTPFAPSNNGFKRHPGLSDPNGTTAVCFTCENCSTVCPVVGHYEDPQQALDLLPHQIIRATALGIKDLALGSRMLWNCLTCYQCQEHCPQGVKVTDIFYELKNLAVMEANGSSAADGCIDFSDRQGCK